MLSGSDTLALLFVGFAMGILLNAKAWDSLIPSIRPSLSFYLAGASALIALLFSLGA